MKRIVQLGLALTMIGATAALAATGDRWYGTYRDGDYVRVEPVEVTRVAPREVYVYDERYDSRPIVIERDYTYAPREYVVVPDYYYRTYDDNFVKPLNPETGHLIDHGLFNRRGPNDFGQ